MMLRALLSRTCQMLSLKRLEFHKTRRKLSLKVDLWCGFFNVDFSILILSLSVLTILYSLLNCRKVIEGHGRESVHLWCERWLQAHDDWKAGKVFKKCVSSVSLHTVKVLFLCTDFANEVDTYSNFIKYWQPSSNRTVRRKKQNLRS